MKFSFGQSYKEFYRKQIYEWNNVRTAFAWFPVYLEDTKRYAWLEKVNYHRVTNYHRQFSRKYYEGRPEPIKSLEDI